MLLNDDYLMDEPSFRDHMKKLISQMNVDDLSFLFSSVKNELETRSKKNVRTNYVKLPSKL